MQDLPSNYYGVGWRTMKLKLVIRQHEYIKKQLNKRKIAVKTDMKIEIIEITVYKLPEDIINAVQKRAC